MERSLRNSRGASFTCCHAVCCIFSTNLTAEVIGLTAGRGENQAQTLKASGRQMQEWVETSYPVTGFRFDDHSGLNPSNQVNAVGMARLISAASKAGRLDGLLRRYFVSGRNGRGEALEGAEVRAKTGSLNFVRGLAGTITTPNRRRFAFAIFSRDLEARAKVDHREERPAGTRTFANRAKVLEQALLRRWLLSYGR